MSKKRSANGYIMGLMKARPHSYILVTEWQLKRKVGRLLWALSQEKASVANSHISSYRYWIKNQS